MSGATLEVRTSPGPKGPQVTEIISVDASTASQEPPRRPRPERPVYPSGDRATVEWWATLVSNDGAEQVIAGCSMLRFDDEGLVAESRDYWHMEPGRRDPPEGWGR